MIDKKYIIESNIKLDDSIYEEISRDIKHFIKQFEADDMLDRFDYNY